MHPISTYLLLLLLLLLLLFPIWRIFFPRATLKGSNPKGCMIPVFLFTSKAILQGGLKGLRQGILSYFDHRQNFLLN